MKKFYELSKTPIIIGAVASVLFCIDGILTKYLWSLYEGGRIASGFIWVAFVAWTISFGMKNNDRIRMWIGHFIGFGTAVAMTYFGQLFDANFLGIGIAALIGIFIFDALVMYFDNFKKLWLNSITGIFMGLFLTFSGLGVGLGVSTFADAGMTLAIILLYSFFGCVCAAVSVYFMGKWKKSEKVVEATTIS